MYYYSVPRLSIDLSHMKPSDYPQPLEPPVPEETPWTPPGIRARWQAIISPWAHHEGVRYPYWTVRENQDPTRPLWYLMLGTDEPSQAHAYMLGKKPKRLGSWNAYICRACLGLFAKNLQPKWMRSPHCGCMREAPGANPVQTHRLEGETFGNLTVIRYEMGIGWECVCECGETVTGISTLDLRRLRKLACPNCAPEEYSRERGSKPKNSAHGKLLRAHRDQEWAERMRNRGR